MKDQLIAMLKSEDEGLQMQAMFLNETSEPQLLSDAEVVSFLRVDNWERDSINWRLLKKFRGAGFEDVEDLSETHLQSFPESMRFLKNLKKCDLIEYQERPIPDFIGELTNLESITMYLNVDLPEYAQHSLNLLLTLPNIKELNLIAGGYTELPRELKQITQLESLYLGGMAITTLPNWLADFQNLQRFCVTRCHQLTILPEVIGKLHNLTSLITTTVPIKELPDSLGELSNLQYLSFTTPTIRRFPPSIGQLSNLKELSLLINHAETFTLPEEIGNLQSLEKLELDHCKMKHLPTTIGGLKNLRHCSLQYNELSELPSSFFRLRRLEILNLEQTKIATISKKFGNFRKMQSCKLTNTNISELPETLRTWKELTDLCLHGTKLHTVPDWIGQLTALKSLQITNTAITEIPESVGQLTNLQQFSYTQDHCDILLPDAVKALNIAYF